MSHSHHVAGTKLSRRTLLRGMGAALPRPWLDAMTPLARAATGAGQAPTRMGFLYVPNGAHMADWSPKLAGDDYELPYILEPLAPFKQDLIVFSGLAQDKGRPHGDGPGDHARALASFLTGCQPKKTNGADIQLGVSIDQLAAQKVGERTKFASLELGCERGSMSGNCDSGYSCAYSHNIAWRTETAPVAKEVNPRLVFERLFGDQSEAARQNRAKREQYRKSILDFVLEDAGNLRRQLGVKDQRKLDEYLSSVREIEQRIGRHEAENKEFKPQLAKPDGVPEDYAAHIRLMGDLLVLAFQSDQTRVATFVLADEGSNRSYPFIQIPEGHHELSHHGRNQDKQRKIREINRFHMEQFAYFLNKMKSVKEGDGTLLDNSMIVYGSGISDGDRHNHDDLPVLLLGKGSGTIRSGRHVRYEKETPLNNLYLAMLDRLGTSADRLGDSSGKIELS